MAEEREFDILLYGVTGYTGKFMLQHVLKDYVLGPQKQMNLSFAIAGRSRNKLIDAYNEVAAKCGVPTNKNIDFDKQIIVADSADDLSMRNMCRQAKVVVTTVGPYILYGENLVKACVEEGTHYCDITGETIFVKRMIEKYGAKAKAGGVKLVSFCGFDCIPTDMAVAFVQEEAISRWGKPCEDVRIRVTKFSGSMSGGTIQSIIEIYDEVEKEKKKKACDDQQSSNARTDPYFLASATDFFQSQPVRMPKNSISSVRNEREFGCVIPFLAEVLDCQVIRWSNALRQNRYGKQFQVNEALALKKNFLMSKIFSFFNKLFLAFVVWPVTRPIAKWFVPQQGQGSNSEEGFYEAITTGTVKENNKKIHSIAAKTHFTGDPGYLWAGRFVVECGIFLARKEDLLTSQDEGGFFSPSAAIGINLLPRLSEIGYNCDIVSES